MKHAHSLTAASALAALALLFAYGCADGTSGESASTDGDDSGATADDDGTSTTTKDATSSTGDDDDDDAPTKDASASNDGSTDKDSGITCDGGKCPPTDGLVAYYAFSGNANDSSPSKAHGTAAGSVTSINDRFGNANSAYLFNGGAASISAPNTQLPTGNASRTLAVWVKATSLDDYNCAANWGSSSSTALRFGVSLEMAFRFSPLKKTI